MQLVANTVQAQIDSDLVISEVTEETDEVTSSNAEAMLSKQCHRVTRHIN